MGKKFLKKISKLKVFATKKNSKQKLCCAWYEEFEKEMLLSKKKKDFCPSQKSEKKNWTKKILCASVFFCMTVKDISAPLRKNGLKKTHYQVFDFFAYP